MWWSRWPTPCASLDGGILSFPSLKESDALSSRSAVGARICSPACPPVIANEKQIPRCARYRALRSDDNAPCVS